MKKVMIIALILVGLLLIPAVSAEVIIDQEMVEFEDTGGTISASKSTHYGANGYVNKIYLKNIQDVTDLHYIIFTIDGYDGDAPESYVFPHKGEEGSWPVSFTLGGQAFDTTLYKTYQRNYLGTITATRYAIYFDEWDIGTLTGTQYLLFTDAFFWTTCDRNIPMPTNNLIWLDGTANKKFMDYAYTITISCVKDWKNRLTVTSTAGGYDVVLQRQYGAINHASRLTALKNDASVYYQERATDFRSVFATSEIDTIKISSASTDYLWLLDIEGTEDPDTSTVTVYVKNSQTGALLADSHIEIQDTTTDPWAEVVNQTLPSGQGIISLTKDPGIHFTQYHIDATVPGYQQVVPSLFFRVTGPTNVIVEMEPLTGGPEDENNTFLEFYVRDISANAIANANVKVDGQLRWTNAQGYTQFEVPKNASYPYSVSKSGYVTIEGRATVADGPRYVVNVVLGPGTVPTYTPGPGEDPTYTPGPGGPGATPTPTQTSPIQEDNLIGLSVRGLAKGFGIDYDTALLLFGLMIIFGTGGIVMSSVKGGAMEFIAGSIVGTFVAFALGLIPIWIFIIIAVVFGAYVLRVFIQGGQ